mmetsp:Transcript_65838/g.152996  ORF Transcript_65838/g.152996 Transcript_65838/m.152996 type:complete len:319 (+) Transcript_65838:44-1000(+)
MGSSASRSGCRRVPGHVAKLPREEVEPVRTEPDAEPSADGERGEEEWWLAGDAAADSPVGVALQQLQQYYKDWLHSPRDAFWQRKSRQTVLAVAVCRCSDESLVAYRGMNTEVSLPSGSLCAERAAIASAASSFHAAREIEALAVMDPDDKINPLWPCDVCQSWLSKLRTESPSIHVVAVGSPACSHFQVSVNGQLLSRPRSPRAPPQELAQRVRLAPGVREWPWQAQHLVCARLAWDGSGKEERELLRAARAQGTHVIVGLRLDEAPRSQEAFDTRIEELLDNRRVSSVLLGARLEEELDALGVRHTFTGLGRRCNG